jgi:hypothetical protein
MVAIKHLIISIAIVNNKYFFIELTKVIEPFESY